MCLHRPEFLQCPTLLSLLPQTPPCRFLVCRRLWPLILVPLQPFLSHRCIVLRRRPRASSPTHLPSLTLPLRMVPAAYQILSGFSQALPSLLAQTASPLPPSGLHGRPVQAPMHHLLGLLMPAALLVQICPHLQHIFRTASTASTIIVVWVLLLPEKTHLFPMLCRTTRAISMSLMLLIQFQPLWLRMSFVMLHLPLPTPQSPRSALRLMWKGWHHYL